MNLHWRLTVRRCLAPHRSRAEGLNRHPVLLTRLEAIHPTQSGKVQEPSANPPASLSSRDGTPLESPHNSAQPGAGSTITVKLPPG